MHWFHLLKPSTKAVISDIFTENRKKSVFLRCGHYGMNGASRLVAPCAQDTFVSVSLSLSPMHRPSNPPTYTKIDTLLHHRFSCRPTPAFSLNTHFQLPTTTCHEWIFSQNSFFPKKASFYLFFFGCFSLSLKLTPFHRFKKNRILTNIIKYV